MLSASPTWSTSSFSLSLFIFSLKLLLYYYEPSDGDGTLSPSLFLFLYFMFILSSSQLWRLWRNFLLASSISVTLPLTKCLFAMFSGGRVMIYLMLTLPCARGNEMSCKKCKFVSKIDAHFCVVDHEPFSPSKFWPTKRFRSLHFFASKEKVWYNVG